MTDTFNLCDAALKAGGVFRASHHSATTTYNVAKWFYETTKSEKEWSAENSKEGSVNVFDIVGIGFGSGSSSDGSEKVETLRTGGETLSFDRKESLSVVEYFTQPKAFDAWIECMRSGLGASGVILTEAFQFFRKGDQLYGRLSVMGRYIPSGGGPEVNLKDIRLVAGGSAPLTIQALTQKVGYFDDVIIEDLVFDASVENTVTFNFVDAPDKRLVLPTINDAPRSIDVQLKVVSANVGGTGIHPLRDFGCYINHAFERDGKVLALGEVYSWKPGDIDTNFDSAGSLPLPGTTRLIKMNRGEYLRFSAHGKYPAPPNGPTPGPGSGNTQFATFEELQRLRVMNGQVSFDLAAGYFEPRVLSVVVEARVL